MKKAISFGTNLFIGAGLFAAAISTLAGCASKTGPGSADSARSGAAAPGSAEAGPYAASGKSGIRNNVIYFDFDSDALKPETRAVVDAWARYLLANPGSELRLEGHADERGSREYNVGLGERRGNAVREELIARGVSAAQISVESYGEDRPAVAGHTESAWRRNRRVELLD